MPLDTLYLSGHNKSHTLTCWIHHWDCPGDGRFSSIDNN